MDNADVAEQPCDRKKSDKVRSAWISFAGRIVAQIVGAIATVALGVLVLHRYTSADARPPAPAAQSPAQVIVITPAMLGLRDGDGRAWPAGQLCAPTAAAGQVASSAGSYPAVVD
jgi:hypothetical protein